MAYIERVFNGRVTKRLAVQQHDERFRVLPANEGGHAEVVVELTHFASQRYPGQPRNLITLTGDEVASLFNNAIPGLKVQYTEPPKPLPQHIGEVIVIPAAGNDDAVMLTRYRHGTTASAWTSERGHTFSDSDIINTLDARSVRWRPATPEETAPSIHAE